MRHRTRRILSMGTGWILVWTALVAVPPLARAGSQPHRSVPPAQETMPARDNLVTACQTHCQVTATGLDTLRTWVQAAQEANDPAQMRAALDEVLQQQAAMQDHMAMCMQMMGMMQSMHGGMGGAKQSK